MGWRVTFPGRAADLFTLGHAGRSIQARSVGRSAQAHCWQFFLPCLCLDELISELNTWPKAQN